MGNNYLNMKSINKSCNVNWNILHITPPHTLLPPQKKEHTHTPKNTHTNTSPPPPPHRPPRKTTTHTHTQKHTPTTTHPPTIKNTHTHTHTCSPSPQQPPRPPPPTTHTQKQSVWLGGRKSRGGSTTPGEQGSCWPSPVSLGPSHEGVDVNVPLWPQQEFQVPLQRLPLRHHALQHAARLPVLVWQGCNGAVQRLGGAGGRLGGTGAAVPAALAQLGVRGGIGVVHVPLVDSQSQVWIIGCAAWVRSHSMAGLLGVLCE